jgi:hypothetical protein
MPSSYSASLRFELQQSGENLNSWGTRLNTALSRIDTAIAGLNSIALTGDYTLTSSTTTDDDSRAAMLKFTGAPAGLCLVTIPSVSKAYWVWNATAQAVVMTTGAGTTATIDAGDVAQVFCDGSNVNGVGYGGMTLKAYIAAVATGGPGAVVPSLTGASGKFLSNDGLNTSWAYPTIAAISDYASDQATKRAAATALSIAFATAL